MTRVRLAGVAVALFLFSEAEARPARRGRAPAGPAKVVAVLPFEGPEAAEARARVVVSLKNDHAFVTLGMSRTDVVLRQTGISRPTAASDFQTVALATHAAGLVRGTIVGRGRNLTLDLQVVDGATGVPIKTVRIALPGGKVASAQTLAAPKLHAALLQTEAPKAETVPAAPPEAAPVAPPAAEQAPPPPPSSAAAAERAPEEGESKMEQKAPPSRHGRHKEEPVEAEEGERPIFLDAALGGGLMHRSLTYSQDVFNALNTYQLNAAPSAALNLKFYPLAFGTRGALAGLGLAAAYHIEPGVTSQDAAGNKFATTSNGFEVGAVYRLGLGPTDLTLAAVYGAQNFTFALAQGGVSPGIPGVSYGYIRPALGARIPFGDFALMLEASYLLVMKSGEISSATYFPRLKVGGLEAQGGIAWVFHAPWEARLVIDYRRYFYTLNTQPGDPFIAGGALDQYLTGYVAIAARFR